MLAFAESPATVFCDDYGITPRADRLAVGRDCGWLADKYHVLLQRDGELARAFSVRGYDRAVVAGAATMHIQIAARARRRAGFRRDGRACLQRQLG